MLSSNDCFNTILTKDMFANGDPCCNFIEDIKTNLGQNVYPVKLRDSLLQSLMLLPTFAGATKYSPGSNPLWEFWQAEAMPSGGPYTKTNDSKLGAHFQFIVRRIVSCEEVTQE